MGTRGRKQNPNWFHCFWMKKEKDAQRRHATGAKGLTMRLSQSLLVLSVCLLFAGSDSSLLKAVGPVGVFRRQDNPTPTRYVWDNRLEMTSFPAMQRMPSCNIKRERRKRIAKTEIETNRGKPVKERRAVGQR